jgi:hypothetical protein
MRIRRTQSAARFNLWSVQGTWFWSLVYPDRHGGAVGAAASETEAVCEAQATIERLRPLRDESAVLPTHCGDSRDSRLRVGSRTDAANCDFAWSPQQGSKMPTACDRYHELWRLTLQQYAARVADA